MDRRKDTREEPPEDTEHEPEDTTESDPPPEPDVLEPTELADADDDEATVEADALLVDEPQATIEADALLLDEADHADAALDAVEPSAEEVGAPEATEDEVSLNGVDEPARLREEAERLHLEAQARQQAAAELREEASKLREEAARLLEAPRELQAEAARLREEARAAQRVLDSEVQDATAETVEDPTVTSEDLIDETDQTTTEIKADRKRGWRRRRRD